MKEITNNHYARHRTKMANERTFLAYMRTSATLFVAGVTFIRFFESALLTWIGRFFVILSLLLVSIGFFSFLRIKKHINAIH